MEDATLPLKGLRVLDLGTFLFAAPFCATILGEFGAEIIKIEKPGSGDQMRQFGSPHSSGDSLVWLSESRNKKSVTLDIRTDEGKALLKRLVVMSDVLVENFRAGTLEKWGVGWEELHACNPRLIMARVTGYGQDGPMAREPAFARIAHAFSGLSYLAGEPGRKPVIPGSTSLADYLAGTYTALGVLMALRVRDATGEGQFVDVSLYEPIFRYLDEIAASYDQSGFVRERLGADTVNVAPHSHYGTKDGKWIAIACTSDKMFARLAQMFGRPDLAAEETFGTTAARVANLGEINAIVGDWVGARTQEQALRELAAGEVPAGPLNSIADVFENEQFVARETIVKFTDPDRGTIAMQNVLPRLSKTPGRIESLGPHLGSHNDYVFGELLGMDPGAVNDMKQRNII